MSDRIMSWSSDFSTDVPTLSLPVGDHVTILDPEEASVMHRVLGEFLADCALHRRTHPPDWGHGANEPVTMYTEDQIRAAFASAGARASDQLIDALRDTPKRTS